jgi:uncharacterized protein DUF4185
MRLSGHIALSASLAIVGLLDICGVAGASSASGFHRSPGSSGSPGSPGSSGPATDCTPASAPTTRTAHALDRVFSDQLGPGWIGGDATYSTELPNGQEAFVFSDTLIGTAQPDGSATFSGLVHNSELVGWLPRLRADYGGTFATPQPLIPDADGNGDAWQVAATYVEHAEQLVFVNEFSPQAGQFGQFTGHAGIAVLRLSRHGVPSFSSVVPLSTDPLTQWGNAVVQDNGYTYVYGSVSSSAAGAFAGTKVARVPRGASLLTGAWQYWNGTGWVAGEGNAATIPTVNELTGVVVSRNGSLGYQAVSMAPGLVSDTAVDLSYACSPEGPWSAPVPVYSIPQVPGLPGQIAYMPTFHPELSRPGVAVISYNVDTTDGLSPLEADIHGYQPRFVLLDSRPGATGPPTETPEAPLPLVLPALAAFLMVGAWAMRRRRLHRPAARHSDP